MAGVAITKLTNGLLYDLSYNPNAGINGVAKYVFRPSLFHTIVQVVVCDDYISYLSAEGRYFSFSYNGTVGTPIDTIDGVPVTDNYDLFTKFTALL